MKFGEQKDRAVDKAREIGSRSWKDQLGLFARIAEMPFCFGVFVNAAIDLAGRGKEHLNLATDPLVTFSLVLSILALVFCACTLGIKTLKKFFHWPLDFFFVIGFGALAGMYQNRAESTCTTDSPHIWDWSKLLNHDPCNKTKANYAFAFMATMAFVFSAVMSLLFAYLAKSWFINKED